MSMLDEIDDLLGGDAIISPNKTPQKGYRMLEESKSPELFDSIKGMASTWLKTHIKGISDESIVDVLRIASIQETYDSSKPSPYAGEDQIVQACDYRFTSTVEIDGDRKPVNITFGFRVGGY